MLLLFSPLSLYINSTIFCNNWDTVHPSSVSQVGISIDYLAVDQC